MRVLRADGYLVGQKSLRMSFSPRMRHIRKVPFVQEPFDEREWRACKRSSLSGGRHTWMFLGFTKSRDEPLHEPSEKHLWPE
jgi:hypothetical protein